MVRGSQAHAPPVAGGEFIAQAHHPALEVLVAALGTHPGRKSAAEIVARKVDGVKAVRNEIAVRP